LSSQDDLTNLLNRRQLPALFSRFLEQHRLNGSPTTALLIDLDNFKQVNDTLGHDAGDHALKKTSSIILEAISEGDLAFRYGGDEFLVLLPGKNDREATVVAQDMIRIFGDWTARTFFSHTKIGVSVGVAEISAHTNSLEQLIRAADTALYAAKHRGKSQVARFTQVDSRKRDSDNATLPAQGAASERQAAEERPRDLPKKLDEIPESKPRNPIIRYLVRFGNRRRNRKTKNKPPPNETTKG